VTPTAPIPQPKGDPFIGNLRSIDGDAPIQGFMPAATFPTVFA
jgi:cytochrome P450 / NADPH-cytochrome P450 reductase